jgi:hypothetical protein
MYGRSSGGSNAGHDGLYARPAIGSNSYRKIRYRSPPMMSHFSV